jgi:serine acetyltransferase
MDWVFVLLAWWPLAWHVIGAGLAWCFPLSWGWLVLLVWVLLLPPLMCRMSEYLFPVRGSHLITSVTARRWWWMQQLQMPFNRLVIFEEIMRLVPGFYQLWLILWGGRVSLFSIIAPGVVITDRQLVRIGRGVVLGNGCLLGGHLVIQRGDSCDLIVAEVTVESGAMIGARAMLSPGSSVARNESMPATLSLRPFQRWQDGQRTQSET